MSSNAPANVIEVKGLSKTYLMFKRPRDRLLHMLFGDNIKHTRHAALKKLSFDIKAGETIGIVGHNGSGKSTLLQLLCGTLTPSSGSVKAQGRISALLELGAGFNPEFSGVENIYLNASILGMSQTEIDGKYKQIVEFASIGEHIHQPVKTYSSGMYVRLAFAVAIASEPEILIIDEALSVGDIAFQRKCFSRIRELQSKGTTILMVSHATNTIMEMCDRVLLLDAGELLMDGAPVQVLSHYQKLMFTPKAKLAAARKAVKVAAQKKGGKLKTEAAPKNHYDASMVPESQVVYEPHGAKISKAHITTPAGKPVNYLKRGNSYVYHYTVKFTEAAHKVRFGMNIKVNTGMVLGGASSHAEESPLKAIAKGKEVKVSFTFTCHLLPGTYFTNAGCTAIKKGERINLHRITDACMFKVLPERGLKATGKVDFNAKSKISGA
jgi:lipopolysaccharide transport system ATP-binding protein